jgi:hypothetical protein
MLPLEQGDPKDNDDWRTFYHGESMKNHDKTAVMAVLQRSILSIIATLVILFGRPCSAAISLVEAIDIGEYDKQYLVSDGVHLPVPAAAQPGDVAVAWLGVGKTTSTVVPPQGWIAIPGAAQLKNYYISAASFYKVLTADDIASLYMSFTLTGTSTTIVGFMNVYRGVDSQSPIAASAVKEDNNYVTSHPNPSFAIPVEGCWTIGFIASEGDPGNITPPSGMTARGTVWWPKVCAADNNGSVIPVGTYAPGPWTLVQGKQTVGCLIVLKPAGSTVIVSRNDDSSMRLHHSSRAGVLNNQEYGVSVFKATVSGLPFAFIQNAYLPNGRSFQSTNHAVNTGLVVINWGDIR